jgi:transcriptional regulator with XRE-family HTH domain
MKGKRGQPKVSQTYVARRLGVTSSTVNKILNRRPGAFSKNTIRKVFRTAEELGYDFSRLKFQHLRSHPRKKVWAEVELSVYLPDNTLFDRGQAFIRDVSLSGALLSALLLSNRRFPAQGFIVGIRLREGPLTHLEFLGKPVRFVHHADSLEMGIEFLKSNLLRPEELKKIV